MDAEDSPAGRWRRRIRWMGFGLCGACVGLFLLAMITSSVPAFHGIAVHLSARLPTALLMLLPGLLLILVGGFPPAGRTIPGWRRRLFYCGVATALGGEVLFVLATGEAVCDYLGFVGLLLILFGMAAVCIGCHRPGGPDDDPMSPYSAMSMGGRG